MWADAMLIDSRIIIGSVFDTDSFTQDVVKNEPMIFNANISWAKGNGGPITRAFIQAFENDCEENDIQHGDCVFDSRVHMLMPGWYPCIPGWHHDDVPRSRGDGQPNYESPEYFSKHVMALVGADVCPTEFAIGSINIDIPETGIVYEQWHSQIDEAIRLGKLQSLRIDESGRLVYFDAHSFHQGTRAVKGGWRWFGRISWNTERIRHMTNEIRNQVQVYLEYPHKGW